MKCSCEFLTLTMSALLLSAAGCGGSADSSKSLGVSAGSGSGRPDKDRGGVALVDAGAADHGGGQADTEPKAMDAGTALAEQPKGGSKAMTPTRDAAVGGKGALDMDPGAVDRGPYYEAESWKGYFWTAKNGDSSTLAVDKSYADSTFGSQLCVKGSVARTPDSSGNAMLGVNVNQAQYMGAPPGTLVPSRAGVTVELSNAGDSPIRVQISAPDGVTNPQARWCATVTGSGGFIPWSEFNTACWDGSGHAYRHEPLSVAMLLVPGNTETGVAFDFCWMRLAESDAPPPGTGAGAATSGSGGADAAAGSAGMAGMSAGNGGEAGGAPAMAP